MNEAKHESCHSMTVLGTMKATSATKGSISTQGGLGVGNNIYVKNEVCAAEIIVRGNAKIGKNLYVMGTIEADEMFHVNNNELIIMKNIMSDTQKNGSKYNIGSKDNRWNSLYVNSLNSRLAILTKIDTENIDIKHNISIGTNTRNKKSMMYIDGNNVVFNGDIMVVDNNMNPIMNINQETRNLGIYNITTKSIEYSPQIVELKQNHTTVEIESNLVFINNINPSPIVTIKEIQKNNVVQAFKMILMSNDQNVVIKIDIGGKYRYIRYKGDYIEGILVDNRVQILNRVK